MDDFDDFPTTSYTYAGYGSVPQPLQGAFQQYASTKVQPPFDGMSSWFKYEEEIMG